ncbi:MAG: MBOAT family protein [Burkholderiales bacterium]|nr:MBOAT family protein [Anaerolineae bacterium]
MSFVSSEFLIFFICVVPLYFLLPHRYRWLLLLIASYFFYTYWNASYVLLILATTFMDYHIARQMDATTSQRRRKLLILTSVTLNLGLLFTFKYFNFFNASIALVLDGLSIPYTPSTLNVLLPVGISFYTFQEMSYTLDVYWGKVKAERRLGIMATFIAFFPQLVAGPIERAANMLPQYHERHDFDYLRFTEGLRLALWGLFKKVVIADRLAVYVNEVYSNPSQYNGLVLIVATIFFAFQIYCDFSAYTDIAIGTARIMGFRLMDNFRQPYFSLSVRDFWRRWHISLSTWFRDYLYIPLSGNRGTLTRTLANLMTVFVLSGLWHGASWTFAAWGALHGAYIVIETLAAKYGWGWSPRLGSFRTVLRWALTFALVCLAWIFFRAATINDALYIVAHLTDFTNGTSNLAAPYLSTSTQAETEFIGVCVLLLFLNLADWLDMRWGMLRFFGQVPIIPRWLFYYVSLILIIISLYSGTSNQQFIYFQF